MVRDDHSTQPMMIRVVKLRFVAHSLRRLEMGRFNVISWVRRIIPAFERIVRESVAPVSHPGAKPEIRRRVQDAVCTMRSAASTECATLRVRLARQAVLELNTAYAEGSPPSTHLTSPSRHEQTIAKLAAASPEDALEPGYEAFADAFAWLERHVEAHTRRELLVGRALRYAMVASVLLGGAYFALRSKNIALGKNVTASSICSFTPDPPLGRDRLYRVVDGRAKEQAFAICTETENRPWVTVDLARQRRIDSVVVFPRNDCCYGESELPVVVELSDDNEHFARVGMNTTPGTADFPWRFPVTGQRARYVRIISPARGKRHIVIGEIEVYGG